jgi:hypothetical protein
VTDKGAPVFLRAMNFGAAALREGQMITMEEMLATVRSVMTTFDRESFGEILVTGVDLDHSVIDQLAERLGLAVRCVRLSKNSRFHAWRKRVEPTGDADENRWEPLIGLAADGGQKSYMRLNLRREELAQLLLTPEIRRRAMFSGALLAVLALAGVLGLNVQLHELGAEADQLDDAIYEVYKEAVPDGALPKGYDVLAAMEQQIDQESTDRIVSPFLGKTLPAIEVLSAVSGCVPPGDTVDITRLEMLLGGTVRLSGLTTDPTVPGKVKEKLAALECLVNVDINQRQDVVKSGVRKVEFSVSGELKPTS